MSSTAQIDPSEIVSRFLPSNIAYELNYSYKNNHTHPLIDFFNKNQTMSYNDKIWGVRLLLFSDPKTKKIGGIGSQYRHWG